MMTPAATVAATIVSQLGLTGSGATQALADWTKIVAQLQLMIEAGTVTTTVVGVAAAVMAGPGTAVVSGTAIGTLT